MLRQTSLGLVALALAVSTAPASARAAGPEDSVVRIAARIRVPTPTRPWAKPNGVEIHGTGVVLEGKKILTNAHLVVYGTEITVQGREGGDKVDAKVVGLGTDVDLALLEVDDDAFLAKRPPLATSAGLPKVTATATVLGFPIGGNSLATTKGVVSRIEYGNYGGGAGYGLRIQVDAQINPGNSGGPAMVDGKMVGLVFGQADNIGYVVPNEEIVTFLADVADGHYEGKPSLRVYCQRLQNPALREKLGLEKSVRGVMVAQVPPIEGSDALKDGDVITQIGDHAIDNEGTVQLPDDLRVYFFYLAPKLAKDGKVPLKVLRAGQAMDVAVPLERRDFSLMQSLDGKPLPYFVHGPLVFAPVTSETYAVYFEVSPGLGLRGGPLIGRRADRVRFPGEELVIVTSPMLQHKITKGYTEPFGSVVREVNGVAIKNLAHLVETLRDGRDPFVTFQFAEEGTEVMVFRRQELLDATDEIMAENGISRRGSTELMAIWNKK
jgi:S1-C subfamily serine protease